MKYWIWIKFISVIIKVNPFIWESIRKECCDSVSNVAKHFIKLLLGVESLILSKCCIVVSDVLPNFLIKSVSQGWNGDNGCECPGYDVW